MSFSDIKPVKRSKLRILIGRKYFTLIKIVDWHCSGKNFCCKKGNLEDYPYVTFTHSTPLLRKLKNVDMWLQYNKIINLKIAASKLDGVVIKPGELFSYWKLIGKPNHAKGYVEGMQLDHGSFKTAVGGGLCQLSNLIYWMTLHTSMTIVERWRHSYDVFPDSDRSQPFGSGATCSYNYIDLQLKNEGKSPFLLHLYLTATHLVGEWRSSCPSPYRYEIYESEHHITHEFWGRYVRHNVIRRRSYDQDGILNRDEFITENHAIMMYEPLLGSKGNDFSS